MYHFSFAVTRYLSFTLVRVWVRVVGVRMFSEMKPLFRL